MTTATFLLLGKHLGGEVVVPPLPPVVPEVVLCPEQTIDRTVLSASIDRGDITLSLDVQSSFSVTISTDVIKAFIDRQSIEISIDMC